LNDFHEKVYEKFFLVHITYTVVDPQIFLAGIAVLRNVAVIKM
jgi:hypothetical protein